MSSAIRAMVNGLYNQSKRNDFEIDMDTLGEASKIREIFYGGAATCAIQEATGMNFTPDTIGDITVGARAYYLHVDASDLGKFESGIDELRCGDPDEMAKYYGIDDFFVATNYNMDDFYLPELRTENWRELISAYENLADELENVGL